MKKLLLPTLLFLVACSPPNGPPPEQCDWTEVTHQRWSVMDNTWVENMWTVCITSAKVIGVHAPK